MYLTNLTLNLRSRLARRDLASDYDLHSTLARAFPVVSREMRERAYTSVARDQRERVLFRVDIQGERVQVIVQSRQAPDWSFLERPEWRGYLGAPPESKPIDLTLQPGQTVRFRLRANPTRKTVKDGRKVRLSLLSQEAQLAWLVRKLTEAGATLLDVRVTQEGMRQSQKHAEKGSDRRQTHFAVRFDGLLQVNDPDRLRATLEDGIGSAKGYGFGLLSLARA